LERGRSSISIYYSIHAQFEDYDAFLGFWDEEGRRHLYGYQLKEGAACSKKIADQLFETSLLIRGKPPTADNSVRLRKTPGDSTLDEFFGVSASEWSAKRWRALHS
jgi:hypothetical protein